MKTLACMCAIGSLIAVAGCSGGGSSSSTNTVLAQSGYSVASLNGTYAFEFAAPYDKNTPGLVYEEVGTITFDGAGKVSGGSGTSYFSNSTQTCSFTFSGTYTVQTSGAGTGSLTATPAASQPTGCTASTAQLAFEIAGAGATLQFAATDGNIYAGTATKQ